MPAFRHTDLNIAKLYRLLFAVVKRKMTKAIINLVYKSRSFQAWAQEDKINHPLSIGGKNVSPCIAALSNVVRNIDGN
jgi:hypothetical protein